VTLAALRRRLRQRLRGHDWFEGASVVAGVLFLAGAVVCVIAAAVAIAALGKPEPEFQVGNGALSQGSLDATRVFGIVLFSLTAVLFAGVGWFLAGDWIRRVFGGPRSS
jgi:hypothetical protein